MPNVIEIFVTGKNLTKPAFDEAARNARAIGQQTGDEFTKGVGDKVKKGLPAEVEKPLTDSGKKGGESGGAAAGEGFLSKASPLMLGAFTAAAAVGPGAILGATALAVVGAGALITKGNAQLQESYAQLGERASDAIQQAAAPLIPELYASVGVLEQGVAKVGPELKSVFSAVAPDVTALTGGLVSLVSNTLPGLASGLRAIAPYAQDLAVDFGKLGSGLGGFFGALGAGAGGGMAGFSALTDVVSALLPDLGKIVGSLSNGLGPALHDVANVAIPVAGALTDVVAAFPPRAIEDAAVATAALFAAFKGAQLAGIIADGTTFLKFLKTAAAGELVLTGETGLLTAATTKLGAAADLVMGPLGVLTAVTGGLYVAIDKTDKGTQSWDASTVKAIQTAVQQKTAMDASAQATAAQATAVAEANNSLATNQIQLAQAAGKTGQSTIAAMSFADAQQGLNTQLASAIGDYTLAKGAASAYGVALQALAGSYGGMQAAEAQVDSNLQSLLQNQKQLGDSFIVGKGAGDQNVQMMNSYTQSILSAAQAVVQQDQDSGNAANATKDLTTYINQQRDAFVQQESKILGSKQAAEQLFDKYLDIKNLGKITTILDANTAPAYSQLHRLVNDINGTVAYVQVGASGTSVGGRQLLAHGGIVGAAASGGPRGNLTWTGEHGPELLDLAPGTRVHSNPDSMRMLAAAGSGGGAQTVQLEFVGGAADPLWMLLREHIRVVGGNGANSVQRVLGQNF